MERKDIVSNMSMPMFLHKRVYPHRFTRDTTSKRISSPDKACICFITNDNPKFVAYTRLACREMRRFIRSSTPIFVLTDAPDLSIPEADTVIDIADLLDAFEMHNISRGRFPDIIFGKFLLPLVPALNEYDRIVCYDPDAIACGTEINDLLDFDFCGHEAIACIESVMHKFTNEIEDGLRDNGLLSRNEVLHLQERITEGEYCSGGMIVWNASLIRKRQFDYESRVRFLVKHQSECQFGLPEQSWMNACLDLLPVSVYYDDSWGTPASKVPIIHYAGSRKDELDRRCLDAGYLSAADAVVKAKGSTL